ncbi:unnamed protein product [Brassicogethes aeneus]|uniref:Uncharacterized protein n=1 Tax=Brassicogethes aeneus TaxID=1431903 RepID=A0A9P0FJ55_BRAAE|nr:unnamed protein product [Brassicogethes aeneus]
MSRHHSNHYSYEDEEYDYPQEDYNNEFYYQDQAGRPVVHNFAELYGRPDGGEIASPPPQIKKEHRRYKQSASIPPEYFYNQAVEEEERMQQKKYVKPKYQYFTVVTPEQYAYKQRVIKAFGQQEKQTNKRYPITVKTPRFFKRSTTSCTVYKQPSTLCLPVISQPDPATHRKSKRQEQQDAIPFEPSLLSKQHHLKIPQIEPHQIDSEGDVNVNVKASHLERLLAQYEQESKMDPLQVDSKSDLARMAKFIKPRVPSSIRLKQERHKMKALSNYEITKIPSTQIMAPEATLGPDTLDKLLNQLKKCEVGRSKSKENQSSQPRKETQETNEVYNKNKICIKVFSFYFAATTCAIQIKTVQLPRHPGSMEEISNQLHPSQKFFHIQFKHPI